MDFKNKLPNINKYIDKNKPYIMAGEFAHEGLIVPEIIAKYGSIRAKSKSIPRLAKYMAGSIIEMRRSYKTLYSQPQEAKTSITPQDIEAMLDKVNALGVSQVGYSKVDPQLIFKDKCILYPNAIILAMEMNHDIIATAPSKAAEKEIFRTYYGLNKAVNGLKEFLNSRGYNAQAGPALGGEVNYPLLAERASMGVVGKHGLLITDKFGPSIRLAAVYTDIDNLPVQDVNPYSWIKGYCDICNRCVRKCPASAIHKDTVVLEDGTKQCIDYKKCAVPFSNDKGCTVCVKECTFFKQDFDAIKEKYHTKLQ